MRIVVAAAADVPAGRALAAQVEPLFGAVVGRPGFETSLRNNVARSSAFCVRHEDGPAGAPLLGGLLWSARRHAINWLAVDAAARRRGIGTLLVRRVLEGLPRPAEIAVTTFADDGPAGRTAQAFYAHLGFEAAESVPGDPPRRVFRVRLPAVPGGPIARAEI